MRSRLLAKEHASHWGDLREVALIECLTTGHNVELDRILWLAAVLLDLTSDDGDRPVVGFNVRYAAGFLDAEMRRNGRKTFYRANAHDVQTALRDAWGYRPTISNAVDGQGLQGITVAVAGPDEARTQTDENGQYAFTEFRAGDYTVEFSGFDTTVATFSITSGPASLRVGESKVRDFEGS